MPPSSSSVRANASSSRLKSVPGGIGPDKAANVAHAVERIDAAMTGSAQRPDVAVLPEVFNSLYAVKHFSTYAEEIGFDAGKPYDMASSPSPTVKALSDAAKRHGLWLFGGSIPEREADKLYNTAIVFNPKGELVATHRKLHLFDIDVRLIARAVASTGLHRLPTSASMCD